MSRPALARTGVKKGDRVLLSTGVARVHAITATGIEIEADTGTRVVGFGDLDDCRLIEGGNFAQVASPLRPLWDSLPDRVRRETEYKLEIVLEIVTGYRDGHHAFARPGEPLYPFGDSYGVSESHRCEEMAKLLARESRADRGAQRRSFHDGTPSTSPSVSVIRRWVRKWRAEGVIGLIDGRALRPKAGWDRIDPKFREYAETMAFSLDGDRSAISIDELNRRIHAALVRDDIDFAEPPQRLRAQYLSWLLSTRGKTTRTQKTRALQSASGTSHYPAMTPGQVVAIDATRADCLVRDVATGGEMSVEVLTAIDVATRVILALRVVLYDVCRPFSMLVDGTGISDWRWCGLPGQIQFPSTKQGRTRVSPDTSTLHGDHAIPSVCPDAIRSDHGSNFMSAHFQDILASFGIDFLPSRGSKPTDNPHVERWHETLQEAWQQIPGYKGRNVGQRGAKVETEALLTADELQMHLRKFVSLKYHRTAHSGLKILADPRAKMTPLEMWDFLTEATGRIDVPQRRDLIFDFLPVVWATIRHDGVTIDRLVYDSCHLNAFRYAVPGQFRPDDRKAPFHRDPHDVTRVWFRDPDTAQVHEIPARGADMIGAPMTDVIVNAAWARARERGGHKSITKHWAQQLIWAELGEITAHPERFDEPAKLRAARLRQQQSRRDLADATQRPGEADQLPQTQALALNSEGPVNLDDAWELLTPMDRW